MSNTDPRIGAGTILKLGDGATNELFTKIAEVMTLGPIGQTAPEVDATPIDATERRYIGGLRDGNTVSMSLGWVGTNAQHKALRDGLGSKKNFQVEWADGSGAKFTLAITNVERGETTAEGIMLMNVEGRITGIINWTDPT